MSLDTIIEITNAALYQDEQLILSDINFSVEKGEFLYVIGKVGSGKSSLIKTIIGEIGLKEGEGRVGEFDLRKLKRTQIPYLRRKIGTVFQDFQLLTDRTIFDNLQFVLRATGWKNKAEIEQRIKDALEKVGLQHKEYKMPHQLSGGEQQRVVIARALLNDPEIILADEPTGNLDPETSEEIMRLLHDISTTGRAVIMATHNYSLLKKFPARTLKCEKGKVIESEQMSEIDFESLMD
jgi:cell division transport system ATP-binding protein